MEMFLDIRPTIRPQHNERDLPSDQILLVLNVLVGRNHDIKTFVLCTSKQQSIAKPGPAKLDCKCDFVMKKGMT